MPIIFIFLKCDGPTSTSLALKEPEEYIRLKGFLACGKEGDAGAETADTDDIVDFVVAEVEVVGTELLVLLAISADDVVDNEVIDPFSSFENPPALAIT